MKLITNIRLPAKDADQQRLVEAADRAVFQLRNEVGARLHDTILFKLITREVPDLRDATKMTVHELCERLCEW